MGSNRAEPIALVQAKGKKHLTKEEIETREAREIKAPSDAVNPPDILTKKQKEEFSEIAKQLIELKIMTNLDVDALARFIISRDMYEKVTRKLRGSGVMSDIDKLDKLSRVQDRYFKACRSSAGDLGLTISSRCKLVLPEPKPIVTPKVNKFEKFEKKAGNA